MVFNIKQIQFFLYKRPIRNLIAGQQRKVFKNFKYNKKKRKHSKSNTQTLHADPPVGNPKKIQ